MANRAGLQGSAGILFDGEPGAARSGVRDLALGLLFLVCLSWPGQAFSAPEEARAATDQGEGPAVLAAAADMTGARLRFDPPPVDLPDGSEQAAFPRAKRPGEPAGQSSAPAQTDQNGPAVPNDGKNAEGGGKDPIRLFGTVEFRGALKNMPKWERVLKEEKRIATFGSNEDKTMPAKVAAKWQALREQVKDQPLMEQVKAVNSFFNQWPYKTDMAVYGVSDYWATPAEFLKRSGDCEDYAITKYYALRNLGVPADKMRVVALKDTIRNLGHAVLVVFVDGNAYVLDNLSNLVLAHSRLKHYAPQFSVNEEYRWAHVVPVNKKKNTP